MITVLYQLTPITEIDLKSLKEGEYFVIKQFVIPVKTTAWFNGIKFDSAMVTHVLIEV